MLNNRFNLVIWKNKDMNVNGLRELNSNLL